MDHPYDLRPRRRDRSNKSDASPPRWLDGCILVSFVVGLVLFGYWLYHAHFIPFEKHMPTYLRPAGAVGLGKAGPIKKMIVVDVREKKIDGVHHYLPDAVRADYPEQITTVVQLRWTGEVVGRYNGGGVAVRTDC